MFAFPEDTLPVCDVLPEGVDALSSGTTVASLSLQQGYYRTSDKSRVVRECFNENACRGGTDVDSYCATGYKGPCERTTARRWLEAISPTPSPN